MNPTSPAPFSGPTHPAAAWCDAGIEVLLTALLVLMPFALGVVAPWSEDVVVGAVALIATALALRAWLHRGRDVVLTWALVPVGLFLAVAAAQLLPLPAPLVRVFSPHSLAIREPLLRDLPGAAGLLGRLTISFYPAATRHDLRLVLAFTVVFLATVQVYRGEERQRRLLWAVVLSGAAAAVLALLQDLSGAEKIYWHIATPRGVANSGPFIAYSNFSQYINLCIGAALGLLLYAVRRDSVARADRWSERPRGRGRSSRRSRESSRQSSHEGSGDSRSSKSSWQASGLKSWRAALLLATMVVGCVTLFLSLSRGGMLSLLCAAGLTWLMLARRRGTRGAGWLLTLVLLVAFGGMLYAGSDAVFDRLATLKTARDPSAGRFQTYKDILVAWRKFPLFGTGLGTHEYVYAMFDRSSDPGVSEFADSDYFQVLEEMGAAGLALVLAFASFVAYWYFKAVRRGGSRMNVVAYGLGFGLAAVMLQSFTDFGQHLPAIGCLSAVFCGLLFHLAARVKRDEARAGEARAGEADGDESTSREPERAIPVAVCGVGTGGETTPLRSRLMRFPAMAFVGHPFASAALPTALAVGMGWAFLGADAARRARAASDRAAEAAGRLESLAWRAPDAEFDNLIGAAAAAVAEDPGNVKARYLLACYRWRAASRPAAVGSGPAAAGGAAETGGEGDASQPSASVEAAREVVEELNRARAVCPTYGPTFAVAGQVERLVLGQPIGSEHVRTAFALSPANPEVCLAAAQLDAAEGRFDDSVRKARRCLALDGQYLSQVMDLYVAGARRPDLAVAAVGDDPERLTRIYYELRDSDEGEARPEVAAAMASARDRLKTACERPGVSPWTLVGLANMLAERNEYAASADYYRRALQADYGQADWHLGLANVLARCGQVEEATHQAEISLHLQPQLAGARDLIRTINTRPVSGWPPASPQASAGEGTEGTGGTETTPGAAPQGPPGPPGPQGSTSGESVPED